MAPKEAFSHSKPYVSHLKIFGSSVYVRIPKDIRSKLDPSSKRGIFVGYSESSKPYRIYIPGQKLIELGRDVSFEENTDCCKSVDSLPDNDLNVPSSPQVSPLADPSSSNLSEREDSPYFCPPSPKDQSISEAGPSVQLNVKKRPLWARNIMQEAENYSALKGTFRESKRPQTLDSYSVLLLILNPLVLNQQLVIRFGRMLCWKNMSLF